MNDIETLITNKNIPNTAGMLSPAKKKIKA